MDTSAIGDLIASAMLDLEQTYGEGKVRSVALVVEVDTGNRPTDWEVYGDDRPWLNRVILEMGLGQIDAEADALCDRSDHDD